MYDKMMEMVFSENVTMEDWNKFRSYMDRLKPPHCENPQISREEEAQIVLQRSHDYAAAARHVASKLTWDEIVEDDILTFARRELNDAKRSA